MSSADKEIEWLRSKIIPKILTNGKLVENYDESKSATFKLNKIDIDFIGAKEAFMLTTCYRAAIKFEYENLEQTVKLVVKKTPPVPDEVFDSINFAALFSNEINFYTRVLPELQKNDDEKLTSPKYYYSQIERSFATIILGDFGANDWRMTKTKVNLSLEHILLATSYIGKFHGYGYALKNTNPELFKQLTVDLKESRYASDELHPEYGIMIKTGIDRMLKVTREHHPTVDEDFLAKLARLLSDIIGYGRQRVAPVEPFATLCHGDYLRNNVAYKYDDNDVPNDIMMFDYQTVRVSSPMIDFSIYIALSTFAEVRHKHFDQIFDSYCNALSETYTKLTKESLPSHLSRDSLLKEYIRFIPYSVHITSSFLFYLVAPDDLSTEEMLNNKRTNEEIIQDTMTRGGEVVDRELAHQVLELYELSRKHGVDFADGIKKY